MVMVMQFELSVNLGKQRSVRGLLGCAVRALIHSVSGNADAQGKCCGDDERDNAQSELSCSVHSRETRYDAF